MLFVRLLFSLLVEYGIGVKSIKEGHGQESKTGKYDFRITTLYPTKITRHTGRMMQARTLQDAKMTPMHGPKLR